MAELSLLGGMVGCTGWPGLWDRAVGHRARPAQAEPRPLNPPSSALISLPVAPATHRWVGDEAPLKRGGPAPLVRLPPISIGSLRYFLWALGQDPLSDWRSADVSGTVSQ